MNKFLLSALLIFICVVSVRSQQGAYRFDNFDMRSGVEVKLPPPPQPTPKLKLSARAMRRGATVERAKAQLLIVPHDLRMSVSQSLDGFTTGNSKIDELIVASAKRNGLDPVLLYAIMHRESSFKTHAVSPKGARGLMQLMPGTAVRFGVRNIFDPAQNIEGGARYVRFLLDTFKGDVKLALAGYNAGEYAVMKYDYNIPPYRETQDYVRLIGARYALMRDPQAARKARAVTNAQAAKLAAAEPETKIYEQTVFAVRLPDGKLRLISQ
jgi:hypothetical protein